MCHFGTLEHFPGALADKGAGYESARAQPSPVDHASRLLRWLSVDNVKFATRAEDNRPIGRLVRTQFSDLRGGIALSGAPGNLKVVYVDIYTVIAVERP